MPTAGPTSASSHLGAVAMGSRKRELGKPFLMAAHISRISTERPTQMYLTAGGEAVAGVLKL